MRSGFRMSKKGSIIILCILLVFIIGLVFIMSMFEKKKEESVSSVAPTIEDTSNAPSLSITPTPVIVDANNADLMGMLSTSDPSVFASFATNYVGQTIVFDGCIAYVSNHGDYKTRYDILVMGGNYVDEHTTNPGPQFKFDDVGTSNLGISDLYLPSFVSVGSNIQVTAKVKSYDSGSGLFYLDPVQIIQR